MKCDTFVALAYRWLKLLLVIALLILITPLWLAVISVLAVYRAMVGLVILLFRPKISILHGSDAMWAVEPVYTKPRTSIIFNLICEGEISVESLRLLFQNHVLDHSDEKGKPTYGRLRQRWTTFMGYYCWEDDEDFSLNHHIRLYDYTEPDLALPAMCTEGELVRVTGRILSKAYKNGTSPWELLFIPNYKPKGGAEKSRVVLCLRIHHALADGLSIVGLIHRLFGTSPPPPLAKFSKLSAGQRLLRNLWVSCSLCYNFAAALVDIADGPNSWNLPPAERSGDSLTFCSGRVPWDSVRAVMNKYKVNSNAAIYSIAVGAAFRLMKEAEQQVPTSMVTCLASYPLPDHPRGLVNHVSSTYFTMVPTVHSGGQLVRQVAKRIQAANVLNTTVCMNDWGQRMASLYPSRFLQVIAKRGVRFTFACTNIPGPRQELGVEGIRLVDIIPSLGLIGGTPAIAIMVSVAGSVRIVFSVDEAAFKGFRVPTRFPKHVEDEISALLLMSEEDVYRSGSFRLIL